MHIYSYKYFLHIQKKLPKTTAATKLILLTSAVILMILGSFSALAYYQYKKEAPTKAARLYLEAAIIDFNSTRTATDELVTSAAVAGTKIEYIKSQEEPPAKAAYHASLDDVERILAQTNLIRKNIDSAKALSQTNTPPQYQDLNLALANYYQDLDAALLNLALDYRFIRDITLAIGPDLYLPVLSQKDLWEKEDWQVIKTHYEKLQESSNTALTKLAKLEVPGKFRTYHEQEIAYITLLVNLSTGIANILSVAGDTTGDTATQIEKAYELLVKSEKVNLELAEDIFKKRTEIFDTKRNLEGLAHIRIQENSLASKLEEETAKF